MSAASEARDRLAYATWDPALATDESDGMPDRAMVPLVESLRARGIVTFQSCTGHEGESDGTLWVAEASVRRDSVPMGHPFTWVSLVYGRESEPFWEFHWLPENADAALARLNGLAPTGAAEGDAAVAELDRLREVVARVEALTRMGSGLPVWCREEIVRALAPAADHESGAGDE